MPVIRVLLGLPLLLQMLVGAAPVLASPPPLAPLQSAADRAAPALPFTDVTAAAGISFVHHNGALGQKLLPETMVGGVAFLDHDGDGDQDLLFVGAGSWIDAPPSQASSLALYANDGAGQFSDVTVRAGLATQLYGMGPAVGDVEGDGDEDLYITAVGSNRLYVNQGGFFVEGSAAAGVAGPDDAWSTAAGFLDLERDGDLDLLVGNYVRWSAAVDAAGERRLVGIPGRAYAPPMAFDGAQPLLFVNRGNGVFDERAEAAGLHLSSDDGKPAGKALAFLFADVDGDLFDDVLVCNDTVRNFLFVNDGSGHFSEQGLDLGVAYDRFGNPTGAMGVDGGHFANDERLGFFVGNFADESSSAYVSEGEPPFFLDETVGLGLANATRRALTFGLLLLDLDLDGRLDLVAANGHIEPGVDAAPGGQTYAQATQAFWNAGAQARPMFQAWPGGALGDLAAPAVGRGLACADIDGDGDLDLALTQVAGPARLLRNDQDSGQHWLAVRLVGRPGQRLALGAEVSLSAGGSVQRRRVDSTRSYLSQVERHARFGLGSLSTVDALSVRWPDGSIQEVSVTGVDRMLTVVQPVTDDEIQATLNRAKAELESGRLGDALATLATAAELNPEHGATWRNLARAHLLANDAVAALADLDAGERAEPGIVSALYLRAVCLRRLDRHDEALPLLEQVVSRDPRTAAVRFQLATALQAAGRGDEALLQLQEAARLDPSHGAAFFQLAVAHRRAGDMAGFRDANREFLRLRGLYGDAYKTPLSLEACVHTLAEAAGSAAATAERTPPALANPLKFRDGTRELLGGEHSATAVAVLSMDGRGRYTLVLTRPDGSLELLSPDGVSRVLDLGLGALPDVTDLVLGNVHDDAPATLEAGTVPARLPDLVLVSPARVVLLLGTADGGFRDGTERAGLSGLGARAALLVDHDHDGDLDLALGGPDGLQLMVNTGGGRFEPSTEMPEVAGPVTSLVAADLDHNDAIDLALTCADATVRVENQRAGRYRRVPDAPGDWPAALQVLADDLDNDGRVDAVLVHADAVQFVFDEVPGDVQPLSGIAVAAACLADPDGDGWLDLVLVGADGTRADRGALRLLRNGGRGSWTDWTDDSGLRALDPLPPLAGALAADLDGDGDSDLLLRSADQRLLALSNDGGDAGGLLKLRLLALMSPSGGIGAQVELRQGDFFVSRHLQHELPLEIGLGGRRSLDSVLAVWPYGVVDARTEVTVDDEPLSIVVIEKADTGSCPFLYVWDGSTRRFICDTVGSGATDLPLSRDATMPVNPREIVVIGPAQQFPAVDGALVVSITSELREVGYYDEAALVVVDHPIGTELASTDRLRPPPFRDSEVLVLSQPLALVAALGSDGIDRTVAMRDLDGLHAPPGPVLGPPLRGVCAPMTLELDFGPLDSLVEPVLALSGWIEFGTASTMIALSQMKQEGVGLSWPALEARDGDGVWHALDVMVGLPGGKRRTVTVELAGLLPPGCDRLRLSTTFQLHWDRAAVFSRVALPDDALAEIRPSSAELRWRGFSSLEVRAPTQPRLALYDQLSQVPPWRMSLWGWCTAYGDVLELMAAEDGMLVVLNSGDELDLRFPLSSLAPVAPGQQRTYLWRSVGYNKEADNNNSGGGQVWPLGPDISYGRTPEEDDAWRLRYNTRWVPADRFHPLRDGTR